MIEQLPTEEWINEQAQQEPEQEYVANEIAIENSKEDRRKNEEEMKEIITSVVNIKSEALTEENRAENEKVQLLSEEAGKRLSTKSDVLLDEGINTLITMDSNLVALTTGGASAGSYFDYNPYQRWGRVDRHNEGGLTNGNSGSDLAANKMFPYAYARGDGSGISDDNDVTTWVKLYFAFWPGRNGHIRALVPYNIRGWYQIYSNDKWYNSKEATVDLEMHVRLFQNYWTGSTKDDIFRLSDDNINRNGRIDVDGNFFSQSMAIGANKWVIAEVAVRARVETEGSGSMAKLNFEDPDFIRIPYVRFDFS